MTDEQSRQADQVSRAIVEQMEVLVKVHGIDPALVLAATHGTVMTEMAVACGGDVAAEMARNAADRVEGLPPLAACELARMPAQGRA